MFLGFYKLCCLYNFVSNRNNPLYSDQQEQSASDGAVETDASP